MKDAFALICVTVSSLLYSVMLKIYLPKLCLVRLLKRCETLNTLSSLNISISLRKEGV